MNPAPCVVIECRRANMAGFLGTFRTRAQIRKGLLRVWPPGDETYFLWITSDIHWPVKYRNAGNRWWHSPS